MSKRPVANTPLINQASIGAAILDTQKAISESTANRIGRNQVNEPRTAHLADWLSRAAAVSPSDRDRMLEPVETKQTATDPVAARYIERTNEALDAVQAQREKLSAELTRLARYGGLTVEAVRSLTAIESELLYAVIHARSAAADLAAWAAGAKGR